MDSDESVANFDPEFTNSSLKDAGINPYEDDGEDEQAPVGSLRHSYNGPGGVSNPAGKEGVAIQKPQRPAPTALNGSPLTSSIQENFRGFTYTGESLMVSPTASRRFEVVETDDPFQPTSMLADQSAESESSDNENAVDDDDDEEEDDDEDDDGLRTRRQSDVDMD